MSLTECRLLSFPKVSDRRGNLTFIQNSKQIPFDIKRIFYVYDIPSGERRGAHAHRRTQQVVICISGALDAVIEDGKGKKRIRLDRPNIGLYIPAHIWINMEGFSSNTVYLVLASTKYYESDYVRDYDEFQRIMEEERK